MDTDRKREILTAEARANLLTRLVERGWYVIQSRDVGGRRNLCWAKSFKVTKEISMPDDKTDRGPADRSRVNVNEDYEVRYWTEEFGCSEDALRKAVERAGIIADDVRRELVKPAAYRNT